MKTGIYKHFKGRIYLVLGTAQHTETGEVFVLYTDGNKNWARPIDLFNRKVQVNGEMVPRFEFQPEADNTEARERRRAFSRDICGNE